MVIDGVLVPMWSYRVSLLADSDSTTLFVWGHELTWGCVRVWGMSRTGPVGACGAVPSAPLGGGGGGARGALE